MKRYIYFLIGDYLTMTVVSVLEMELALKNTLGKKGMKNEDLKKLAEYIAGFFGYAGLLLITAWHLKTEIFSTCWRKKDF